MVSICTPPPAYYSLRSALSQRPLLHRPPSAVSWPERYCQDQHFLHTCSVSRRVVMAEKDENALIIDNKW